MIDLQTGAITAPKISRFVNDPHTLNIEIDVEDFYTIVNSLTDSCGCAQCSDLALKLKKALSAARK
jgi:hypothetical protein